jgi:hypothetical protein
MKTNRATPEPQSVIVDSVAIAFERACREGDYNAGMRLLGSIERDLAKTAPHSAEHDALVCFLVEAHRRLFDAVFPVQLH